MKKKNLKIGMKQEKKKGMNLGIKVRKKNIIININFKMMKR